MIIEAAENFTPEEIAELERRRARHLRGEGTSYTLEESIQSCATPGNEALRPDGPPAPATLHLHRQTSEGPSKATGEPIPQQAQGL